MIDKWVKDFSNKKQAKNFIKSMFEFNPNKRATAAELVNHRFFDDIREDYATLMNN